MHPPDYSNYAVAGWLLGLAVLIGCLPVRFYATVKTKTGASAVKNSPQAFLSLSYVARIG